MTSRLLITADDSTGAMEAGALCADAGFDVVVAPHSASVPPAECLVVDLRSRHVAPDEARRRMAAVDGPGRRVHKIDSTLRGNWAAEIGVVVDQGCRVVLIPANPALGRTCVGGVLRVDGVPVAETEHGSDPRHPVRSSRPSESCPAVELAGPAALADWIADGRSPVAIVDASTIAEIETLVDVVMPADEIVLAGSAAVVGAVARATESGQPALGYSAPWLPPPLLVVCASLHPVSRAQVAAARAAGVAVIASPEGGGDDPDDVAAELAKLARTQALMMRARSVVLVGGDTAAAFLGDSVVRVLGSIGNGISLGDVEFGGRQIRCAAKPGGFGSANTLVDLIARGERP
jgi:D-threonate/D-erythronate kinase